MSLLPIYFFTRERSLKTSNKRIHIPLLINQFVSLIELKIQRFINYCTNTCKFKVDKVTYSNSQSRTTYYVSKNKLLLQYLALKQGKINIETKIKENVLEKNFFSLTVLGEIFWQMMHTKVQQSISMCNFHLPHHLRPETVFWQGQQAQLVSTYSLEICCGCIGVFLLLQ